MADRLNKVIEMPKKFNSGHSPTSLDENLEDDRLASVVRREVRGELKRFAEAGYESEQSPSVDELYANLESSHHLKTALRLLDEALILVDNAIASYEEDPIGSDYESQKIQSLLPELFCCRGIGDGFGALMVAIQNGFANRDGDPLEIDQLQALLRSLQRIRLEPFLTHDQAVDSIMELEDTGLVVEPVGLGKLADKQDEASTD